MVFGCLVPGPGIIKAEEYCLLGYKGQTGGEGVGVGVGGWGGWAWWGSGLVSLHIRGLLLSGL